jgi:phosphate transport system substrate-binding protein
MKKFILLIFLFWVMPVSVCAALAEQTLRIEGTGDSQKLLRRLAAAFTAANPETRIVVPDSVGSSGGVRALIDGRTDIARVARPLKEKELSKAADLVYYRFALSPVLFVANLPENCVDTLSNEQIVGIFKGSINDWSQLGNCPRQEIYLAMREKGDSSRTVLEKNIPGLQALEKTAGKVVYTTPETAATITEHPFTLGYLPKTAVSEKLKVFTLNGVFPNGPSIQQGRYPLVTPYGLVWRGQLSALGQRFIDFIDSPGGHKIISSMGAVPVTNN